jgi:hypothetical protein
MTIVMMVSRTEITVGPTKAITAAKGNTMRIVDMSVVSDVSDPPTRSAGRASIARVERGILIVDKVVAVGEVVVIVGVTVVVVVVGVVVIVVAVGARVARVEITSIVKIVRVEIVEVERVVRVGARVAIVEIVVVEKVVSAAARAASTVVITVVRVGSAVVVIGSIVIVAVGIVVTIVGIRVPNNVDAKLTSEINVVVGVASIENVVRIVLRKVAPNRDINAGIATRVEGTRVVAPRKPMIKDDIILETDMIPNDEKLDQAILVYAIGAVRVNAIVSTLTITLVIMLVIVRGEVAKIVLIVVLIVGKILEPSNENNVVATVGEVVKRELVVGSVEDIVEDIVEVTVVVVGGRIVVEVNPKVRRRAIMVVITVSVIVGSTMLVLNNPLNVVPIRVTTLVRIGIAVVDNKESIKETTDDTVEDTVIVGVKYVVATVETNMIKEERIDKTGIATIEIIEVNIEDRVGTMLRVKDKGIEKVISVG